jgi:hypothetical protein
VVNWQDALLFLKTNYLPAMSALITVALTDMKKIQVYAGLFSMHMSVPIVITMEKNHHLVVQGDPEQFFLGAAIYNVCIVKTMILVSI